ncbi:MAG: DUF1538 domain-containing protein [Spirochaetales bacterium]|nr:DUF1538 domain-containing protein [Spirochaetales bacterium]
MSKLKETLISVLPIMAIVLILNFTIAPLGERLVPFIISGFLLVIGLSLFLAGTDIGMAPVGEKLGSVLTNKRNVWFMLAIGFIIGFGVTLAEPDVTVLVNQVHSLNPAISASLLKVMISLGLGIFVDIGLMKTVFGAPLKWVLLVAYLIVFVLVGMIGQSMASISFDASGATTGPLAVPFLLALGIGVSASTRHDKDGSFGLTGISSVGPILAVAIMAMAFAKGSGEAAQAAEAAAESTFWTTLLHTLKNTAIGFAPLLAIILVLQFTILRFPKIKFRNICFGIVFSFIGIVIFLSGAEFGFVGAGRQLGILISGNSGPVVTVLVALVFGGIVVIAEPAVWVLTKQVEQVTAGRIKRRLVMVFLAIGVAIAVGLAILRSYLNINYLWFIFLGVGLSLGMMFICPPLFSGIAFDSGGVASGPMSTTFLLSFALGVSGSADMGFGLVGLVAISPLIAIQILGVIFRLKEQRNKKEVADAASAE